MKKLLCYLGIHNWRYANYFVAVCQWCGVWGDVEWGRCIGDPPGELRRRVKGTRR